VLSLALRSIGPTTEHQSATQLRLAQLHNSHDRHDDDASVAPPYKDFSHTYGPILLSVSTSTLVLRSVLAFLVMQIRPLKRSDTTLSDDTELANITYNDKYVVVYDFSDVGMLADSN
jgi:hypothetical protein